MREAGFLDQLKYRYKSGDNSMKLLYWNVIIFLVLQLGLIIASLYNSKLTFLTHTVDLLAANSEVDWYTRRPWTAITYMFLHLDFFHILFNMVLLYFAGKMFVQFMGNRRVVAVYLYGGLFGVLLHVIAHNVFPIYESVIGAPMLGASASVMAIFIAIATYAPNMEVFLFGLFRVKLVWIALFAVLGDVINLQSADNVAHFAHLGGAIFGHVFVLQLRKGKDWSVGLYKFFNWVGRIFKPKPKVRVKYSSNTKKPPRSDHAYNEQKMAEQEEIDAILDKISKSGYDSLTKKEKETLFKASNDN